MPEIDETNVLFKGRVGTVNTSEDLEAVMAQGGQALTPDEAAREIALQRADTQNVQAGTEAVLRGATAGLSDPALVSLGVTDAESLRLREEANPVLNVVGQGLGIAGAVAATGGTGAALRGAAAIGAPARAAIAGGEAVAGAVRTALAARVPASIARVAATGAGLAAEGAAFGAGRGISEAMLDGEFTTDAFVGHVGMGALVGGALGAGGRALADVVGAAVPAGVKAAAGAVRNAAKRAGVGKPTSAGVDAAEINAIKASRSAHKAAEVTARATATPHVAAVTEAARRAVRTLDNLTAKAGRIEVPNLTRTVGRKAAPRVVEDTIAMSRTARTAAAEVGDTAAQRAASAFDKTVGAMPATNVAGRFKAATKLRNELANAPTMQHVVAHLDDHLSDVSKFGQAATEFAKRKEVLTTALNAREAFASTLLDEGGKVSRGAVESMLGGVTSGNRGGLETLSGLSDTLDDYLLIIRAPGKFGTLATDAKQAAAQIRKALRDAEKAVTPVNDARDAARSLLDTRAAQAASVGTEVADDGVAPVVRDMLKDALKGGVPGGIAAAALGLPFSGGALAGNLARMARNPQQVVNMLERLANVSAGVKQNHGKVLADWVAGKAVKGKTGRATASFIPGLSDMLESKSSEKKREGFRTYRRHLEENAVDGEMLATKVAGSLEPVADAAPKLAEQIMASVMQRLHYLLANAPQTSPFHNDPLGLLGDDVVISDAELTRFARVAQVVEDPTSIVPRIADATVTREEVVALRQTSPAYHRFLIQTLAEQLPKAKNMPYAHKLTLGTVFEVPTTAGLQNTQFYQQTLAQAKPQGGGSIQTSTPAPIAQSQLSPLDRVTFR